MRPFSSIRPIHLSTPPSAGAPSRKGRFLFTVIVLYYLPPLLILSGHLPFAWRFHILAIMTSVMLAYDFWHGIGLKELGFRRDTLTASLLSNAAATLLLVTTMFLSFRTGIIRDSTAPDWRLFFVYYVFVSSPSQEFLFRSNLFALMRRNNIRWPFVQIILSAITFSFLHIIYRDPLTLLATFTVGLLWGWIYYRYSNFVGVAASHAVVGAVAIKVGLI